MLHIIITTTTISITDIMALLSLSLLSDEASLRDCSFCRTNITQPCEPRHSHRVDFRPLRFVLAHARVPADTKPQTEDHAPKTLAEPPRPAEGKDVPPRAGRYG